jgi:two-component system copper resistance phosphate regulon response regulator CusR
MSGILIVEDEERISSFVEKGLRAAGFSTRTASLGASALEFAATGSFDLMVLDIGLPDLDGFEVLRRLRSSGSALPVIVLTARDSRADTVSGLEGGANDYMAKPFAFDELLARIRLRLRDASHTGGAMLEHAGLSLDTKTRRATIAGRQIELSAREFGLAEEFLRHPDQVLSREQLLSRVWGFDFDPGSNVVDVYVRYLRAKFGADRIETVRGMGYRLR